jgi:hypothetical protein
MVRLRDGATFDDLAELAALAPVGLSGLLGKADELLSNYKSRLPPDCAQPIARSRT